MFHSAWAEDAYPFFLKTTNYCFSCSALLIRVFHPTFVCFSFLHFSLEQMHGNEQLTDVNVACLQEPDAISVLQHLLRFV